jgi:putative NADH-flavin reductase
MKVVIFGATGGVGRQLVEQALTAGHTVTALVRNPATFSLQHDRLTTIQGSVLDPTTVETAITGQDAVLSALGSHQKGKITLCTDGIEQILMAMVHQQVRRLVVVSAYGANDSHHRNFYNLLLWLLVKEKMLDKERMEALIARNDVDWTIVRPTFLTNGARTSKYCHGSKPQIFVISHISRANVADFMLQQIADPTSIHQTFTVTN